MKNAKTGSVLLLTAIVLLLTVILLPVSCRPGGTRGKLPPNIIFILVDDLGYGDLGCYGSPINDTPNIDRLAEGGLKFIDFHSNGPMCSPTRASFLTGLYQYRFGSEFERALDGKAHYDLGLPLDALTIPEVLKPAGYKSALFGKWHLGYQSPFLPLNQGFDEFAGLGSGDGDHHTHVDRSGRLDWWKNNRLEMENGYSTDLITDHSLDFIRRNRNQPFFLYVSYLAVHFPWQGPEDPPHRQVGRDYHDDKWGIIPDRKNVSPHIEAMVESVDRGVGDIVDLLRELKIEEDTLVFFTSDNGGYINYRSGGFENISSNGVLRGQKTELYEGGHRVPAIAYWPGRVSAGTITDQVGMSMDMLPTFADLAGIELSSDLPVDGISLLPLLDQGIELPERTLFWKSGSRGAVRRGPWKLVIDGQSDPALFNLTEDLGESHDLAGKHPEIVRQCREAYQSWVKQVAMKGGSGEKRR